MILATLAAALQLLTGGVSLEAPTMSDLRPRWVWYQHRGNDYGVSIEGTWPHISLGISLHIGRFGHLSFHLPIGCIVIGCIGTVAVDLAWLEAASELRAPCIHGRYEAHTFLANPDFPESTIAYRECPGGWEVTDAELVRMAAEAQQADPALAAVWADAIGDGPSTVTSADWFNRDDNI